MELKTFSTIFCKENETLFSSFVKRLLADLNYHITNEKYFPLDHNHTTFTKTAIFIRYFMLIKMPHFTNSTYFRFFSRFLSIFST